MRKQTGRQWQREAEAGRCILGTGIHSGARRQPGRQGGRVREKGKPADRRECLNGEADRQA